MFETLEEPKGTPVFTIEFIQSKFEVATTESVFSQTLLRHPLSYTTLLLCTTVLYKVFSCRCVCIHKY